MMQQRRHDLRQLPARERAPERTIGAGVPAPHQRRHLERMAKARLGQPIERLAVVRRLRESERGTVVRRRRRALEQRGVVALHVTQVQQQGVGEGVPAGKPAEARKALQPLALRGQDMGLLVRHHLQAVLDDAQEPIGRAELVVCGPINPVARGESVERRERRLDAQLRMAAAGNELLGLYEKLDLANAAAAEFQILSGDGNRADFFVGMDLPLHRMHVGDRSEVEILAPDER